MRRERVLKRMPGQCPVPGARAGGRWGASRRSVAGLMAALLTVLGLLAARPALAAPAADPFESFNRAVFSFNESLDKAVIKPAARAYTDTMPELFRLVLGNFFSNLSDPWIGVNNLLQGKPLDAMSDFGRFALNTVLCFGLGDIASELGLRRNNEDLGQTLGVWGMPSGPYLVLPLLGPSSLRDAGGRVVDIALDPSRRIADGGEFAAFTAVRIVDLRAALLPMDRLAEGAMLDRYTFFRNAYLQRRPHVVSDGNPPEPSE